MGCLNLNVKPQKVATTTKRKIVKKATKKKNVCVFVMVRCMGPYKWISFIAIAWSYCTESTLLPLALKFVLVSSGICENLTWANTVCIDWGVWSVECAQRHQAASAMNMIFCAFLFRFSLLKAKNKACNGIEDNKWSEKTEKKKKKSKKPLLSANTHSRVFHE